LLVGLGSTITYAAGNTQYARVDILKDITSPRSIAGSAIAQTLFNVGCWPAGCTPGPGPNPWFTVSFDITSSTAAGGTFYLRFAAADNQLFNNFAFDEVGISVSFGGIGNE